MKLELRISIIVVKLLQRMLCCLYSNQKHRKMRSIESLLEEADEVIAEIENIKGDGKS
jgi:hypothetical protein